MRKWIKAIVGVFTGLVLSMSFTVHGNVAYGTNESSYQFGYQMGSLGAWEFGYNNSSLHNIQRL